MKKIVTISFLTIFTLLTYGCTEPYLSDNVKAHETGIYRGIFIDRNSIQINVEFKLTDGVVTEASFRHLRRDDNYRLTAEEEPYRSVIQQYKEALSHLIGKDIEKHLEDLYAPENVISTEVDGYTSATVRSSKIISAVRDGLNRGVYSY